MVAGPTGRLGNHVRRRVGMASESVTEPVATPRLQLTGIIVLGTLSILLYVKATIAAITLYLVGKIWVCSS